MKQLFIFFLVSMLPVSAHAINYCQFNQDPLDEHFVEKYSGPTGWMPAESVVRMQGGSGTYYCKLKERQLVALEPNGQPHTFVTCGNTILDYSVPQQAAQVSRPEPAPRNNNLMALANRPMGDVRVVDGTNPKARMTAEQFRLRFNLGASANWHFGLPDTNVQQNQSVSSKNNNKLQGGSSSSSSSRTIVRKNEGGDPGGPENPPQGPEDPGGGPVNPPN